MKCWRHYRGIADRRLESTNDIKRNTKRQELMMKRHKRKLIKMSKKEKRIIFRQSV